MPQFAYHIQAQAEDGQIFDVSSGHIEAESSRDARQKAKEEGWDDRLNCTGCRPRIKIQRERQPSSPR